MSVIVAMSCDGDVVEIEVFKDTHVQFADENVEYEVETEKEFGQESPRWQMLEGLRFSPRHLLVTLLNAASSEQIVKWMFEITGCVGDGWENIRGNRMVDDIFPAVLHEASLAMDMGRYTSSLEALRKSIRIANAHTTETAEEYLSKRSLEELVWFTDAIKQYLDCKTGTKRLRAMAVQLSETAANVMALRRKIESHDVYSVRQAMEFSRMNRTEILSQIGVLVEVMEEEL